jgi:hypothetical protein
MYAVGMFFNIGLPSLVGGDVVKAAMVSKKTSKPLRIGLASVFQDRAAGLLSLLVFGTVAAVATPLNWRGIPLWSIYAMLWSSAVPVTWFVVRGHELYAGMRQSEGRTPLQRIIVGVAEFHQALGTMDLSWKATFQLTICSLSNSAIVLWMFQQVTEATGHPVGILHFSALFPLISLLIMLPISLGGVGIREWTYVEAFSLVGIEPSAALFAGLTTSALVILCNLSGAPFLLAIPSELKLAARSLSVTAQELPKGK